METPVLFLIFNRPETTRQVFEKIREARPKYLYIAADGPRKDREGETEKCEMVRSIATTIDWDCELKTLFRDENLGCGKAVSQAITWFFENVEEGIILEDDCLPDISFFRFCTELLEKYRTDERVMSISGSNLSGGPWKINEQSYFWSFGGIWGWATWRRSWKLYDYKMTGWDVPEINKRIKDSMRINSWVHIYSSMFDSTFDGTLNTWDAQWFYTILFNGGVSINSGVNLVSNIGFGKDGTHVQSSEDQLSKLVTDSITFPLVHPRHRMLDLEYLNSVFKNNIPPINENNRGKYLSWILRSLKSLKSNS